MILKTYVQSLINYSKIKKPWQTGKKRKNWYLCHNPIAGSLYDIHLTGAREDAFRSPMKLYGRLSALASDIGGFGVDFKPTDQQRKYMPSSTNA